MSRLVSTNCAREEWTYETTRASALGPARCVAKSRGAIGDLTDPPAIEAAFKAMEKMFPLNAVNARADAGLVAYGLARRAGILRVIYFSMFQVNQFRNVPHFAAKVGVETARRNVGAPFTVIRAAYWFQKEIRSRARRTAEKSSPGACRSSRTSAQPIQVPCGRSDHP